jgi:hypothetical protein
MRRATPPHQPGRKQRTTALPTLGPLVAARALLLPTASARMAVWMVPSAIRCSFRSLQFTLCGMIAEGDECMVNLSRLTHIFWLKHSVPREDRCVRRGAVARPQLRGETTAPGAVVATVRPEANTIPTLSPHRSRWSARGGSAPGRRHPRSAERGTSGQEDGHRVVAGLAEKPAGRRSDDSMARTLHPVPSPLGRGCGGVFLAAGDKRESYPRLTVTGDGARGDEAGSARPEIPRQSAQQQSAPGVA